MKYKDKLINVKRASLFLIAKGLESVVHQFFLLKLKRKKSDEITHSQSAETYPSVTTSQCSIVSTGAVSA